jgi:hypothetical protein
MSVCHGKQSPSAEAALNHFLMRTLPAAVYYSSSCILPQRQRRTRVHAQCVYVALVGLEPVAPGQGRAQHAQRLARARGALQQRVVALQRRDQAACQHAAPRAAHTATRGFVLAGVPAAVGEEMVQACHSVVCFAHGAALLAAMGACVADTWAQQQSDHVARASRRRSTLLLLLDVLLVQYASSGAGASGTHRFERLDDLGHERQLQHDGTKRDDMAMRRPARKQARGHGVLA